MPIQHFNFIEEVQTLRKMFISLEKRVMELEDTNRYLTELGQHNQDRINVINKNISEQTDLPQDNYLEDSIDWESRYYDLYNKMQDVMNS